jgi:hypothetical protein
MTNSIDKMLYILAKLFTLFYLKDQKIIPIEHFDGLFNTSVTIQFFKIIFKLDRGILICVVCNFILFYRKDYFKRI